MRHALVAAVLCFAVAVAGIACAYGLVRWSLAALSGVPPLSWEAVRVVWAFAWAFSAVILVTLLLSAVILAVLGAARHKRGGLV